MNVIDHERISLPLSVLQLAKSLIPKMARDTGSDLEVLEEFLLWPPDLFALTSHILSVTGAYHLVVSPPRHTDEQDIRWPPAQWPARVRRIGLAWRNRLNEEFSREALIECKDEANESRLDAIRQRTGQLMNGTWVAGARTWVPGGIWEPWDAFKSRMSPEWEGDVEEALCENAQDSDELRQLWKAVEALITLHAIADEACIGWGIRDVEFNEKGHELRGKNSGANRLFPARLYAEERLRKDGTLATIDHLRCRVLPKRHTPEVGITLRSISSNLAYHRSSVDVKWGVSSVDNPLTRSLLGKNKSFSILLLPWPLNIRATSFKPEEPRRLQMNGQKYGFFSYSFPQTDPSAASFGDLLVDALKGALSEVDTVDMVVLPECALSEAEVAILEHELGLHGVSAYVAGVYAERTGVMAFSENMVYFRVGHEAGGRVHFDGHERYVQYKHHRWKLDRNQITNYNIGHVLSPGRDWWEAIKIRRRRVTFVNVGQEVTVCPLICEDLARQDPIADLIRAVGPSLVITVLMDGPQKMDRWPSRYAGVLAEDPGSAVITLTSAGMVRRWRPPHRQPSKVVALWNDGRGSAREIELEEDSIGVLLGICAESRREPTADCRTELFGTNTITLGSINQVRRRAAESGAS